jgi:hypothetical protein
MDDGIRQRERLERTIRGTDHERLVPLYVATAV